MSAKIHLGNVGVTFKVPFVDETGAIINISTAAPKQIFAKLPDHTVKTFAGAFTTDGSDGLLQYTTNSTGDLSQSGDWRFQGYVVMSGEVLTTDITTLTVYANVDTP